VRYRGLLTVKPKQAAQDIARSTLCETSCERRANLRYKGGAHRLESLGRNKSSLLRVPVLIVETGQLARTDINYASLRKECLYAIKNWPGCESVAAIQLVRNGSRAGFSIKVTLPGEAELITVERATACVEREMRRRYRLAD
jgi:hypothetical protein